MRKIILALSLLLAASTLSKAQCSAFGIGYCMTNEWCNIIPNQTYHGFYVGYSRDIEISDVFAFVPGLTVNMAAGTIPASFYKEITGEDTGDGKRRNWSANLPLLFKAGVDFSGKVRGFIQAGPNLTFGLTARDTHDGIVINYYGNNQYAYSRWNVGIAGGIGIDINQRHRISANYTYGFLDASKIAGVTDHSGFMSIGYSLLIF